VIGLTRFCRIVHGNSARMTDINDCSIGLIVTSPPYGSVVAYNRDNPFQIGNYREADYFKMIRPVYEECKRVLKPGRRLVVNIANVPADGESGVSYFRYGDFTADLILSLGFDLSEIIVWDKGRCRRPTGATGTLPYPASPVLLANWEYIYVFKKHGKADYDYVMDSSREKSRIFTDDLSDSIMCVWHFQPEARLDNHPAPFPVELPKRVITLYSFVDDIVLDPFAGSGSTGVAALSMNRSTILYELEEGFISVIKARVGFGQLPLFGEPIYWTVKRQDPNNPENIIRLEEFEAKPDESPAIQGRYRPKQLLPGQKSLFDVGE